MCPKVPCEAGRAWCPEWWEGRGGGGREASAALCREWGLLGASGAGGGAGKWARWRGKCPAGGPVLSALCFFRLKLGESSQGVDSGLGEISVPTYGLVLAAQVLSRCDSSCVLFVSVLIVN